MRERVNEREIELVREMRVWYGKGWSEMEDRQTEKERNVERIINIE